METRKGYYVLHSTEFELKDFFELNATEHQTSSNVELKDLLFILYAYMLHYHFSVKKKYHNKLDIRIFNKLTILNNLWVNTKQ